MESKRVLVDEANKSFLHTFRPSYGKFNGTQLVSIPLAHVVSLNAKVTLFFKTMIRLEDRSNSLSHVNIFKPTWDFTD